MHGMLSAAVIMAAFAMIALLSGAAAAWIFRAAGVAPQRSRSERMTGMPGAATGPAPDAPGEPDKGADRDADRETDRKTGGTDAEYPERSRLRAVLAALGRPARTTELAGGETEAGAGGETEAGATGEPDDAEETGPPRRTEGARCTSWTNRAAPDGR